MNTENNKLLEQFKGTPAPWKRMGHHVYEDVGGTIGQSYVQAINYAISGKPDIEGLANAQLMACAPELLAMCIVTKLFLEPMIDNPASHIFMQELDALIKKATLVE